jgi:hypothetical protein
MSATDKSKLDGIAAGAKTGTVTSVAMTVPTGLSISGSPITTSGTLAVSLASGYSIPTTAKQTQWDTAYTHSQASHDYLPLSGGTLTGNLTAPSFIGSLTGNADTSTKLQTARTIWGQSFDGTGNVTGALSGATTGVFSSTVTSNSGISSFFELSISGAGSAAAGVSSSGLSFKGFGVAHASINWMPNEKTFRFNTGDYPRDTNDVYGPANIEATGTIKAATTILTNLTANYLPKHTANGLVNSLIYDDGTNVGIGQGSPSYKLDVNGTGRFTGALTASSTITATGNLLTSANLIANTGITIAQIDGTGVGLSLYGTAGTDNSTNPRYGIMFALTANKGTHGAVTGDFATYFTMNDTAGRGWIFTTDPVGTGGNVASISNTGNITASGEITAYVASDRRLKHNITPLFSSLDIIDKLNPVSYYWNAKAKELNPMKSDSLDYGLIAQEVENVLPGVVHGIFDDKYKSIDYIKLIPIMIAAIKELKQKTDKL